MRFWAIAALLFSLLSLSSCSSLFYYPSRQLYYAPKRLGFQAREISFQSHDGTRLFGWYFPAQGTDQTPGPFKPKGTLIQFHGNAENMSSHYLSLVWLVRQGYELFVFDYRGYGKSEGDPSQEGTYWDGLAALEEAWRLHEASGAPQFIVVGQSLGGAIAMRALSDFPHKNQVDLLVLDSTFMSYKSIARKKLASFWLTWPFSWLGGLLVSDQYSAEQALKDNRIRLLVIHDENDPAVPFSCAEDYYPKAHEPKEFWKLNQGGHVATFSNPHSPYRKEFVDLLNSLGTQKR